MSAKRCRHFNRIGILLAQHPACKIGHPVRKMMLEKVGNPIGRKVGLLCCYGGGTEILDCPDVDLLTEEEKAQIEADRKTEMEKSFKAFLAVVDIKEAMIRDNTAFSQNDCPACGAEKSLTVSIAGGNLHARAYCEKCNWGFIE